MREIKVLIVEDDVIPAVYLKKLVEREEGLVVVESVVCAQETLCVMREQQIDIVFMDIMLKGPVSGAELALQIHQLYPKIIIIFMTAYSTEEMLSFAVEAEAFAYLLKPYRPEEIKATLALAKAQLKRYLPILVEGTVALVEGFSYNTETRRLSKKGREIDLSPKELELIDILCKESDRVVDSKMILQQMRLTDASLRSIIYRIRKDTSSDLIQSVKRLGYRIGTI